MRAPARAADGADAGAATRTAPARDFTLGGFVAGALLAGIALSVHVLVAGGAMVAWASRDWWAVVASVVPAGAATGLAGAGIGWWLGSRRRPDPPGDRAP